jgi:hypothetical protein
MPTATATRQHRIVQRAFAPAAVQTEGLPEGVCGRLIGTGLVYEQEDSYGTTWVTGCLDMTKRTKVPAGRVQLFTAGPMGHEYGVRSHVGVVRSCETRGNEEIITADLFDTEDGRRTKEYLDAVLRSQGTTGLSIGCYVRRTEPQNAERFAEVELEEFTITPRPAVPGAEIDAVRQAPDAMWAMFDALAAALPLDELHRRVTARLSGHTNDPVQAASGTVLLGTPEAPRMQSDAGHPAAGRVATEAERARALAAIQLWER